MSDEPFSQKQHFQQAIDTTITCRSIIKYNSTLNEQQKAELLTSIDATLSFLKTRLAASGTNEADTTMLPHYLADHLVVDTLDKLADVQIGVPFSSEEREPSDLPLKNLYRIYHGYLNTEQIAELETRYRMVMGVLEHLEEVTGQQHDIASSDLTAERMLYRIRGFITALYCTFREFAAVFSNLVEGKAIDMDTETLSLLDKYAIEEKPQQILRDITPLMRIYTAHLQLQERKGMLTRCAGDAIAFLVFLEEGLEPTFARREEIITQLKAIGGLLNDLTRLLAEYEQAMSTLIGA